MTDEPQPSSSCDVSVLSDLRVGPDGLFQIKRVKLPMNMFVSNPVTPGDWEVLDEHQQPDDPPPSDSSSRHEICRELLGIEMPDDFDARVIDTCVRLYRQLIGEETMTTDFVDVGLSRLCYDRWRDEVDGTPNMVGLFVDDFCCLVAVVGVCTEHHGAEVSLLLDQQATERDHLGIVCHFVQEILFASTELLGMAIEATPEKGSIMFVQEPMLSVCANQDEEHPGVLVVSNNHMRWLCCELQPHNTLKDDSKDESPITPGRSDDQAAGRHPRQPRRRRRGVR
jgi:hypothetical protein